MSTGNLDQYLHQPGPKRVEMSPAELDLHA